MRACRERCANPLFFAAGFLLWIALCASPNAATAGFSDEIGILHMAHRGGGAGAPENTLSAFQNAMDHGADYIECDLRMTLDEVLVCHHDATVDRTTDGTGLLAEMTLAEAKALDAGSWFDPAFSGEQIPTLEEALLLVNQEAVIIIDAKFPHWAERAAAVHQATGLPGSAIGIWANTAFWVDDFHVLVPGSVVIIRHGWSSTVETVIEWFENPNGLPLASAVAVQLNPSTSEELLGQLIHLFHAQGIPVIGYIYNGSWQWDTALELGIDGIMTQDPASLAAYFEAFECANGIDDDLDAAIDHPSDGGCESIRDQSERATCDDGLDNDQDGAIDFPDDLGCTSKTDSAETSPYLSCDDGLDNDGDYWADTWDPECSGPLDPSEQQIASVPGLAPSALGLTALVLGMTGFFAWRRGR